MDITMKARIQRTNTSILPAHNTVAFPGRVKQVEAQSLACSDEAAHVERVKMLQAQVEAGTYIVDSQTLARKMQILPVMRPLPDNEKHNTLLITDQDELHE